jgi:hypothetical protein
MLDVQSFQGLLSAAFTIQEHNDRRRQEQSDRTPEEPIQRTGELLSFRLGEKEDEVHDTLHARTLPQRTAQPIEQPTEQPPAASLAPEVTTVCQHCGAPKLDETGTCPKCGLDQFRPGERLQRNWASMWLTSQQRGLWPERSSESDEAVLEIRKNLPIREPQPRSSSTMLARSAAELSADDHELTSGREAATESYDRLAHPFEFSALDEFFPDGAPSSDNLESDPSADSTDDTAPRDATPKSLMQRLADLSVTVRFHRADLYLGISLLVAVLALLWPTAASPSRHALGPWERALITLGIAEAPAPPVVRLQGDPGIQVWVDTHTALYYCPGEEQYGKTSDGHVANQREAQMDRFEPASRNVCD